MPTQRSAISVLRMTQPLALRINIHKRVPQIKIHSGQPTVVQGWRHIGSNFLRKKASFEDALIVQASNLRQIK